VRRHHHIATIFLLLLVLAPVIYFVSFHVRQQSIHRQMKEELEQKSLHHITVDKKDIHWVRFGKELIIHNQLFDVKSISQLPNGKILLAGLFDREETSLVHQLHKNQESRNTEGSKQIGQLFQFIAITHEISGSNSFVNTFSLYPLPANDVNSCAGFAGIITPPPQG
jgi:hypothetical protein